MNKILLLFAHPATHKSRINSGLANAVKTLEGVTFNDLYENYPDFHINVKREQDLLKAHDIIIWQFPFYWYNCPAVLKEWMDLVLEHNFAYGKMGTSLVGKKMMLAISTGGSADVYSETGSNHYTIRQFLAPFHQTALLCHMEFLPPFVVHGSHLLDSGEIENFAAKYELLITRLRNNDFSDNALRNAEYINDLI